MDPRPTAIVAGGNQVLAGCVRAMVRHGVRIPTDVSLVTCDEVDLSELHEPPIASVARDTLLLGRTAAELLLERLGGGEPRTVLLPTTFTPRPSCGPVPTPTDPASSGAATARPLGGAVVGNDCRTATSVG